MAGKLAAHARPKPPAEPGGAVYALGLPAGRSQMWASSGILAKPRARAKNQIAGIYRSSGQVLITGSSGGGTASRSHQSGSGSTSGCRWNRCWRSSSGLGRGARSGDTVRLRAPYVDFGCWLDGGVGVGSACWGGVKAGGVSGDGPVPYRWPAALGCQGPRRGRCDLDRRGVAAVERVAERPTARG